MNTHDPRSGYFPLEDLPGLFDPVSASPDEIDPFFAAAEQFYRTAPWTWLSSDQPVEIEIEPKGELLYAILLGPQAGGATELTGLVLYDNLDDLIDVLEADDEPTGIFPDAGLQLLTFESEDGLPQADREAIRDNGWRIAGPQAFPRPMRLAPDGLRRPTRDELNVYTAVLHALAAFAAEQLEAGEDGDYLPVEAEYEVQTEAGVVRLILRYPAVELDEDDGLDLPLQLSEAQVEAARLAHAAWEEADSDRRVELAQQALALSPDAADAYTVLAEEADYPEESLEWLQKAVDAGESWLTAELLDEAGDDLWSMEAARPFLRARLALAETLEQLGRPEPALEHYLALLALNPADHPGARYPALTLLLRLKRDAEAQTLIDDYEEEGRTDWDYNRALLAFRSGGDHPQARRLLHKAIRRNPAVPSYLTAARPLPLDPQETAAFGAENEASAYALKNYPIWWSTPGAVQWLAKNSK